MGPKRKSAGKRRSKKNQSDDEFTGDELDKKAVLEEMSYNIPELLAKKEFEHDELVLKLPISEFNMDFIRDTGLSRPMLFPDSCTELGMKMPSQEFGVVNVLENIGPDRMIEVVQVKGQKGKQMRLGHFIEYYLRDGKERDKAELLNVLSLEFTLTQLELKVVGPSFVKEIDWVEIFWPKELKKRQELNMQINGKNPSFSTFPKVQRYCLMSVKDCFTDFHVDFGGTSVWYHVLKGRKVFWIIPPTEQNLSVYEDWLKSDPNNKTFFGDIVEKCARVELTEGNTFIIPSGWIHCVFTPQDSLVFGGNFLHSYAIPMQLNVVNSEDNLRIGTKYRYTYFKQILWYVIEKFVRESTRRKYLMPIKVNPFSREQLAKLLFINSVNNKETKTKNDLMKEMPDVKFAEAPENRYEENAPPVPGTSNETSNFGMEVEESEMEEPPKVAVEYEYADDGTAYEICYDLDVDNSLEVEDPNYLFMPYQNQFSTKNFRPFVPVGQYNDAYLNSLTKLEKEGLPKLVEYFETKVMSKKNKIEYPEGITRPLHLFQEFQAMVKYLKNIQKRPVVKVEEKTPETITKPMEISTEMPCVPVEPVATPTIMANIDSALNRPEEHPSSSIEERDEEVPVKEEQIHEPRVSSNDLPMSSPTNEFSQMIRARNYPLPTTSSAPTTSTSESLISPSNVFDPLQESIPLGNKPLAAYKKIPRKTNASSSKPIAKKPILQPVKRGSISSMSLQRSSQTPIDNNSTSVIKNSAIGLARPSTSFGRSSTLLKSTSTIKNNTQTRPSGYVAEWKPISKPSTSNTAPFYRGRAQSSFSSPNSYNQTRIMGRMTPDPAAEDVILSHDPTTGFQTEHRQHSDWNHRDHRPDPDRYHPEHHHPYSNHNDRNRQSNDVNHRPDYYDPHKNYRRMNEDNHLHAEHHVNEHPSNQYRHETNYNVSAIARPHSSKAVIYQEIPAAQNTNTDSWKVQPSLPSTNFSTAYESIGSNQNAAAITQQWMQYAALSIPLLQQGYMIQLPDSIPPQALQLQNTAHLGSNYAQENGQYSASVYQESSAHEPTSIAQGYSATNEPNRAPNLPVANQINELASLTQAYGALPN